jgi:hypothetical protein
MNGCWGGWGDGLANLALMANAYLAVAYGMQGIIIHIMAFGSLDRAISATLWRTGK